MSDSHAATTEARVVRVFISSTFRDFGEERDLLMKRVFPELRRRARDRFVEVIGVDLRWGITEAEAERGETLPICLREIERSRPYFVGLLGERYGWTPAPDQFPESLIAQQPWLREHVGGKSLTELEVLHGVLNNPAMAGRASFYMRDPSWSKSRGPDFQTESPEARARLLRLRKRVKSSGFPTVRFRKPEEFARRVLADLWKVIDAAYPADAVPDPWERERRVHEAYAAERRRVFIGKERVVEELLARLEQATDGDEASDASSRATVVVGRPGEGRSSLIANTLAQYRARHPNDLVFEHYAGAAIESDETPQLMWQLCVELKRWMGLDAEVEGDEELLRQQLARWLDLASTWSESRGSRIVIAIAGLDELRGPSHWSRCVPERIARGLRLVVSTAPGWTLDESQRRGYHALSVGGLAAEDARTYVTEALSRAGRRLPDAELARIVAHPQSSLPLFLQTLVGELCVFGSYADLPRRISECLAAEEPDDLFEIILARVGAEFGAERIGKALTAIRLSASGLYEPEVLDATGLAPLQWQLIKLQLGAAMRPHGYKESFAHAYARKAVDDRYLSDETTRRAAHLSLGRWRLRRELNQREVWFLLYHYGRAVETGELLELLACMPTGPAILRMMGGRSVLRTIAWIGQQRGDAPIAKLVEELYGPVWRSWRPPLVERLEEDLAVAQRRGVLAGVRRACRRAMRWGIPMSRLIRDSHGGLRAAPKVDADAIDRDWCETVGELRRLLAAAECRPEFRQEVADESVRIARRRLDAKVTRDALAQLDGALYALGWLQMERGLLGEATASFEELAGIGARLATVPDAAEDAREATASALVGLARVQQEQNALEQAVVNLERALQLSRVAAEQRGVSRLRHKVGYCLDRLAWCEMERGRLDRALMYAEQAHEIARAIAQATGGMDALETEIAALVTLGWIRMRRTDHAEARAAFESARVSAETLLQQSWSPRVLYKRACVLAETARLDEATGAHAAAAAGFQQCADEAREQCKSPVARTTDWKGLLRNCLNRLGSIACSAGDFERAYRAALELRSLGGEGSGSTPAAGEIAQLVFAEALCLRCELELGRMDEARASAGLLLAQLDRFDNATATAEASQRRMTSESRASAIKSCISACALLARAAQAMGDEPAREAALAREVAYRALSASADAGG